MEENYHSNIEKKVTSWNEDARNKSIANGCIFIIISVLLLVLLASTNPGKSAHQEEVGGVIESLIDKRIEKILRENCRKQNDFTCDLINENGNLESGVKYLLDDFTESEKDRFLSEKVKRKNFYFFSLTSINGDVVGIGIINFVFVSEEKVMSSFESSMDVLDFLLNID